MTSTKHKLIRERYTHCLICEEPIEKPNFQRKYCSKECYEEGQKRELIRLRLKGGKNDGY